MIKLTRHIMTAAVLLSLFIGCDKDPDGGKTGQEEPSEVVKGEFAEGADISWVTQMEKDGEKFFNAAGKETECTELMKELGMNAIRLRVWVDPEGGWCAAEDVLAKAERAQKLGMRIMIDFHYSDTWADPGNQKVPAAWEGFDAEQLADAVAAHTSDVLELLKDKSIKVEWVQIGNEINSGMLHPSGNISDPGMIANFVKFVNAGHDAAKSVFPDVKVILHRSNGHDAEGFRWFLDLLKFQKVRYDIIGMSLYPTWWENGGWRSWRTAADACLKNISDFSAAYGKPVMICEFGMPVSEPQKAKDALGHVLTEAKKIEECHGIFWWEPQTDGKWKPSYYDELGWSAYNMGAFADGKATAALDPFKD